MSASTVSELLHALEQTIRDRFQVVNEVLRGSVAVAPRAVISANVTQAFPVPVNATQALPVQPNAGFEVLVARLAALESRLVAQDTQISELRAMVRSFDRPELLPKTPMDGLEVVAHVPAKVEVAKVVTKPEVIKAESEVKVFMVKEAPQVKASVAPVEEVEAEEVEAEVEEVEEEVEVEEEAEAEAEEEAVELTAFEYKGITYYRDSENNVYAEEDGEVSDEPFGIWNEARQRILARK
jgi:hypothetical protein